MREHFGSLAERVMDWLAGWMKMLGSLRIMYKLRYAMSKCK
jgi:hypothetical protein